MVRFHHDFDAKRFILPDEFEQGYAWWLGRELDNPNAVLLVAEDDASHELLGYTYGTLEETNWSSLLGPHGAFQDLWVDSHARGNGIGKRLVEETLLRFRERGARQVVLMTAVQNQVAQRLAHALGFRQTMIEMTKEL
jgi:ribosomal protein S18 acetylase RimI-like enzyme